MYPKVKVRQEQYKEDRRVKQDNNLKALLSLSPRVSPSPGLTGPEKDDNLDEDRVNIRASPIPPPRAVISSPINDAVIGNKNRIKGRERLPGSKNNGVLQNRHALCKVKSSNVAENSANTRKPMEAADKSSNLTDSVQKRRPTKPASNQKTKMIIAHPKKWEF